jgi:hypothetical protein
MPQPSSPHRSACGECGESHSPTHRRAERSLVALSPFPDLFSHAKDLLIEAISPSLEDCHAVPNSRWQLGSVALPLSGQACARFRPGGGGSARDYRRRSWLNTRKRPHPQAGGRVRMGPSWQSRSNSASSLCGGGRSVLVLCFSHITFRPIPLSHSDSVPGLVHLCQRFVD